MDSGPIDPLEAYRARREHWQARHAAAQRLFISIGNYRLVVGCVAAVLAWLAFGRSLFSPWWLLLTVAAFLVLVVRHQLVVKQRTAAQRALSFYDSGMRRIAHNWMGKGNPGDRFRDAHQLYAEDLDVFGKGSLFEFIANVRTAAGEQLLAEWLLAPATQGEAQLRQGSAVELSTGLLLREDLALLGEDINSQAHVAALERWGAAPPVHFPAALRRMAPALAVVCVGTLIAFLAGVLAAWPFLVVLAINLLIMFRFRRQVASVMAACATQGRDLRIVSVLIERLEGEEFHAEGLKRVQSQLESLGKPASVRIAHLQRRLEWLESGEHWLARLLKPLVLWNEQTAMAVEMWRQHTGASLGQWLRALAEFEALSSLGTLAFEHPDWSFPRLLDSGTPQFSAVALRHPLISSEECVPNDVELTSERRLLIVSGSNMSGKSTLLRAIGLNTVLAWAGAPVPCASLDLSRMHVGASIRVTDSLQDKRSRFFSEIQRIREIVDLSKLNERVLFLLDELLSGTNSHDRQIGANGIIRGLLNAGCVGLVTTHDLALTEIVKDLGQTAANVHFEDQMRDGRLEFDYRLRPGVVTHSNALELMRAVGLDV